MQNSLCTIFIWSKLLILSVFRANLKNDKKNDTNFLFSHSLRMIYTNSLDTKGRIKFFFTPCDQIFHNSRSFWYIWIKSCKILPFFEKTATKKLNFWTSTPNSKMNFHLAINLIMRKKSLNSILLPKKRIVYIFVINFHIFSFLLMRQRMQFHFKRILLISVPNGVIYTYWGNFLYNVWFTHD